MNMKTVRSGKSSLSNPIGRFPLMLVGVLIGLTGATVGYGQAASIDVSSIPQTALANGPLYASGARAKPTLTLALSVEFPTVGASYRGTNDYAVGNAYLGYFNPDLCYSYNRDTEVFDPKSSATSHQCGGNYFSGNFMNWATTSSIDILRYGLTGGDRIIDTSSTTALQRAVLPKDFYNKSSNFPAKSLSHALVAGAMPAGTLKQADGSTYTGTVYIANCLNRVYFGTKSEGNCDSPGANGSLDQVITASNTPVFASSLPNGANACANENGTCTISPNDNNWHLVYYGAGDRYYTLKVIGSIGCNNATFGDPYNGTPKKCYFLSNNTDAPGGALVDGKSPTNYFLTRVTVCSSMTGDTADIRTVNGVVRNFCTRYPNGQYKPTGDLQIYSDRIRVAAFGYLMDNTVNRYGGVLRAPMKYVGPTAYDSNFDLINGTNPQSEWDATTGVFALNPMGETTVISPRTTAISGVINYLNQFGRTGGTPGTYKTYDPVGELYYEALRYLQGLPVTSAAVSNMTDAQKEGFPVYSTGPVAPTTDTPEYRSTHLPTAPSFVDPQPAIDGLGTTGNYKCVANNIITIGDIHTHYDGSLPGTDSMGSLASADFSVAANPAGNMPNMVFWTDIVAGFETNADKPYIDGSGTARNTKTAPNNPKTISQNANLTTRSISDNNRFYLDGAAYWANTHDIRGVPFTGTNSSSQMAWASSTAKQRPGMRVTSYVIDVNETNDSGTLAQRQQSNQFALLAKYGGFNASLSKGGSPFMAANGAAADLWERGSTGDPSAYFLASDAATVLNSLDQIFATVASNAASIAGTSSTSTSVTTAAGASGFRASFSPSDWTGDLYPFTISTDANNVVTTTPKQSGTGGWSAAAQLNTNDWNTRNIVVGSDTGTTGVPAEEFKTFSTLTASQQTDITAGGAIAGQDLVDYLRGDHSKEAPAATGLRQRSTALGDIINSGIVYKGKPSTGIADSGYSAFYTTNASRTAAVYVGANDGMLHAFNAANGNELFGYIPSFVVSKLHALTTPGYVHQNYVDATPVVSEAQLGTADTDWKTVLVSGAGGGGQGVFALDVTNPSTFDKTNVLWEFTDKDDPDMGNVIGKPGIYKFRTNAATATTPTYGWYAVVASGVNNYADDGHQSTTGNPALFILDLSKPSNAAWALNSNYYKISLPQADATKAMGVANFSVVTSGGVVSRMYAGDLQGNVWSLVFTNKASSDWKFSKVNGRTSSAPLFIAKTGGNSPVLQPITTAPEITSYGNNYILTFGTGKYIESTDNSGPYTGQTAYAVLDPLDAADPATLDRGDLKQLTASGGIVGAGSFIWGIPSNGTTQYGGWYFDLPDASNGERFVSNFAIYAGTIFANSIIPASGGCSEGSSNSYVVGIFGSGGSYTASNVGLVGPPLLVFVGTPTGGTDPNSGLPTQTVNVVPINSGSGGVGSGTVVPKTTAVGVRSWRQIFSYKQLSD